VTADRALLRFFWLLFFATPVLAIGALILGWGSIRPISLLFPLLRLPLQLASPVILVIGAGGSGYFLAKRNTQTVAALIVESIVYAFGILIIYAAIVFVGLSCLAIIAAKWGGM
jgi:hypothetical protein